MSRLILVRHGQSVWNAENRFTGFKDVELSSKGRVEAVHAGTKLKNMGIRFDAVFTSTLRRAYETAEIGDWRHDAAESSFEKFGWYLEFLSDTNQIPRT